MKTEDRATPLFTATAFVAVSAALFFLSGCSADSSIAGASEEESTVSAEAVNQGTALARGQVSSETVVFGEVTDPRDGQKYRTVKIGKCMDGSIPMPMRRMPAPKAGLCPP